MTMNTDVDDNVTIDQLTRLVDELANISTPTPASGIIRLGLITELRNELRPSIGSTSSGRGGLGRIPIDPTALKVWEDVTGRVLALHLDLDGDADPPRHGSLEQILNAWARELVAIDASHREYQGFLSQPTIGLNQDARRQLLHKLNGIRDAIDSHFNPPRKVEKSICPECSTSHVLADDSGDQVLRRAVTITFWPTDPDREPVAACDHCGATWTGLDRIEELNDAIETLEAALEALTHSHRSGATMAYTTDPTDPRLGHGADDKPTPQQEVYLILSEEERAKGFIRPVRRSYRHDACGTVTTMGTALAETYARDPKFYGATYCVTCGLHAPVSEFTWDGTTERVGS